MAMGSVERAELAALRSDVELLKRAATSSIPAGLEEILSQMSMLSDRLTKIETRSKPGPKPKDKT